MKKGLKKIFCLFMVLCCGFVAVGCGPLEQTPPTGTTQTPPSGTTQTPPSGTTENPPSGTTQTPPSGTTENPPSGTTNTGYYAPITATSGTELLGQLHDLITSSRTKYSSYADIKTYGTTTDPGSKSNTVMEFYTQTDIDNDKWDVSGGWNREHVWPKSISNGLWKSENVGGGADLHHIRPAEKDLNAHRGNLRYSRVSTNKMEQKTSVSNILGGYTNGPYSSATAFEPLDNVKGDVARILFYVYTHYNTYTNSVFEGHATTNGSSSISGYSASFFGTLNFTLIIAAGNNSEAAAIKLLLEWNKSDPVDEIETRRNEEVYKIQGNRNPFIDNASYADAIWGETVR